MRWRTPIAHRLFHPAAAALLVAAAGSTTVAPRAARADTVPIDVVPRGQNRILVDGLLGDWRRFLQLLAVDDASQVTSGQSAWRGADDAAIGVAFARDDQSLYFAAEVRDDQVVRSRGHGEGEDALVISLAVPGAGGRMVGYDIVVQPGEPGAYAGSVRFGGGRSGAVTGAQVVEAPLRDGSGFTIEVAIPWRAIPEINAGINSLRGRVAYRDADGRGGRIDSVLATGPGDAQHPGDLAGAVGTTGQSATNMVAQFQASHGLTAVEPLLDRSANIAGDAGLERVIVFPRYILAMGSGIAGGSRYAFVEFPVRAREDVLEPALRDLTGDGRMEVILRVRQPPEQGLTREVLYVYGAPGGGDSLSRLFAHELGRSQGGNAVSNRATYEGGARIRVTFVDNQGYTEANYPRLIEPGVLPPLTAWGDHRVVWYRWQDNGQRFEIERSEPNPNARRGGAQVATVSPATSQAMVQAPSDTAAVLRLFRQQRGIPDEARPNFAAQANVAGDPTPETVQIFGRQLVVAGPRFQNGRSFYTIELPANADNDVLGMELADVTDDGRSEVVVRMRRQSQVQVRGRALDMIKEFVIAYSLDDAHRGRVFAAEVSRRVGNDAIVNSVRALPRAGRNGEIVIEAGRSLGGWNEHTYPFHDMPAQGYAPILLPWDGTRRVVYRWNGTALAPAQ